jgi:hypothetical protein
MMRLLQHPALFTLLLALIVLFLVFASRGLGPIARFVPLVVALPTLLLLIAQLLRELRARRPAAQPSRRRPGWWILWTLLLPPMIYGLGFHAAVPLYAFVQLRGLARERWPACLAVPAALLAMLWLCGRLLPAIPLWRGALWPLVGIG